MSFSFGSGGTKTSTYGELATNEWIYLLDNASSRVGFRAYMYNPAGQQNTVFGYMAAADDTATSGNNNVLIGTYTGYVNRGDFNTWIGTQAADDNITGEENVGVGYKVQDDVQHGHRNSYLGFNAGANSGSYNVAVGHNAGKGLGESNISVGISSKANGEMGIAIGSSTSSTGDGAIVLGGQSEGRSGVTIGNHINSTGNGSLLIMPTGPSGEPYTSTTDEHLNIYGVLTGAKDPVRGYEASLKSDSLILDGGGGLMMFRDGGINVSAASNVSFNTPTNFTQQATFTERPVFASGSVFVDGLHAVAGTSTFDGPVVFNETVTIGSATDFIIDELQVRNQAVFDNDVTVKGSMNLMDDFVVDDDLSVGGNVTVDGRMTSCNIEVEHLKITGSLDFAGALESLRVLAESLFVGPATFKSGIHVCCGPAEVDHLIAKSATIESLNVSNDFTLSNATATFDKVIANNVVSEKIVSDTITAESNLFVTGDGYISNNMYVSDNLYTDNLFTSNLSTGSMSITGALNVDDISCKTITTTTRQLVLGESILRDVSADNLLLKDNLSVEGTATTGVLHCNSNLWVENEANVDTLVVRSDADIQGDIQAVNSTFSNLESESATISNLVVTGSISINGSDDFDVGLHDATLTGTTTLDYVLVEENATFKSDVGVEGTLTVHDLVIDGSFALGGGAPFFFQNDVIMNQTLSVIGESHFYEDVEMHKALKVHGGTEFIGKTVHSSNVEFEACAIWKNANDPLGLSSWDACLIPMESNNQHYADLQFKCNNGTTFTLTDDFEPGVLNFTGKHRCTFADKFDKNVLEVGTIVTCTGGFESLTGGDEPAIDEALPVVKVCSKEKDPAAFGVISGVEEKGNRLFRLANMCFRSPKAGTDEKVIVNSVGEGGMYVADVNGRVTTGDLLTSSYISGHAQLQSDDVIRSYTVAKVTGIAKDWEPYFDPVSQRECTRAFVGVVYKF